MKTKATLCLIAISSVIFILTNCTKTTTTPLTADTILFDTAMNAISDTSLTLYRKDSSFLLSSPSSGHNFKYFRVLYNSTAYSALTNNGTLPQGGSFPAGSLVVKEFTNNVIISGSDTTADTIKEYAVIQKEPSNSLAGDGWLWGEYLPDGSVVVSVASKGVSNVNTTSNTTANCLSCHSSVSNYDYNWVFTTYP